MIHVVCNREGGGALGERTMREVKGAGIRRVVTYPDG